MALARAIAANTLVQVAGRGATTAIGLVTFGILTRAFGVAGYGEYTTIFTWLALVNVIADFGLSWIMVGAFARTREEGEERSLISRFFGLRLATTLPLAAAAGLLAWHFAPYSPTVRAGLAIAALAVVTVFLTSVLTAYFQARLKMERAVFADILQRLLVLGATIAIVRIRPSLLAVVSAVVAGTFLQLIASLLLARRGFLPRFDWQAARGWLAAGWPIAAVSILAIIHFRVDTILLSLLKSQTEVGIYGAPYKVLEIVLGLPAFFIGVLFPALAQARDDLPRIRHLTQRAFDALSIAGIPATVGLVVLARPIMEVAAGRAYLTEATVHFFGRPLTADLVLALLAPVVFLAFWVQLFEGTIIALGRQRLLLISTSLALAANIVVNFLAIPRFSYLAAAATTIGTELVLLAITFGFFRRLLGASPLPTLTVKAFLAALGMGIVLFLLRGAPLWASIPAGALFYFGLLWLFGGLSLEMIRPLLPSWPPRRAGSPKQETP